MRNTRLIIAGTILAVLLLGLLGDAIHVYSSRQALENHLLDAARAGIGSIEDEEMARILIKDKAAERDLNLMDGDILIDSKQRRIIVTKGEVVKTRFSWLLGHRSVSIFSQVRLRLNEGEIVVE